VILNILMQVKFVIEMLNRFANISMKMNDPLQTLYQIMSGRQPAAATVSFKGSSLICLRCSFYCGFCWRAVTKGVIFLSSGVNG